MNNVTLTGYMYSEGIKLRRTPEGIPVTSFVLKVMRDRRKLDDSVTMKYDYITIVCWNDLAEYAVENYEYNTVLEVQGSIRTSSRLPKGYKVYKEGSDTATEFYLPVFEVHARRIAVL